jgi:threonine/homoserine/homoserine lactone efflux protein
LHSHVWAYDALRYLGAVYLAVLAWRAWAGAGAPLSARGAKGMRRAVIQGFMTNILNPKVALFVLAFLPQFTNPAVGPVWQQMLLLGGLFTSTGLIVTIGYGVLAGTVSTHLQRHERRLEKISAVAFGGLAARMAWQ